MHHRPITLGFAISALAALTSLIACAPSSDAASKNSAAPAPADYAQFLPESDIHYGEDGYALSVFRGSRIERVGIRLLGILTKVNSGKDLILFRVTSGPPVTRSAMIIAGMSGSPVYVHGKLVGAISYGMSFSREPIGLITPIRDMLDVWNKNIDEQDGQSDSSGLGDMDDPEAQQWGAPIAVDAQSIDSMAGAGSAALSAAGDVTFDPLATPVSVSGLSPAAMGLLAQTLKPFHLFPVLGGGASAQAVSAAQRAKDAVSLVPGSAVGASLVQGDVDMTAIGTVTYRAGDRIVAFGHPFTGIGPIDAALTTASIADVLPSYEESTKLGTAGATVGRVTQDRAFSISGRIGDPPQMIPVRVTIADQTDSQITHFNARVIDNPILTGPLALSVADQAMTDAHGNIGDTLAVVTTDIDVDGIGHIRRTNTAFDPMSVNGEALQDLSSLLTMMRTNAFHQVHVNSIALYIKLESRHGTAQIDSVQVPNTTVAPGDTVDVSVVLHPYKQAPIVETIPMVVPLSAPDGQMILNVSGGATQAMAGAASPGRVVIVRPGEPELSEPRPQSVLQMVDQFLDQPTCSDVQALLILPDTVPEIGGIKLKNIPPTMAAVIRSVHRSNLQFGIDEVKSTLPTRWVVSGSQQILMTIQQKDRYEVSPLSPTFPVSPAAPSTGAGGATPTQYTSSTVSTMISTDSVALPSGVQPTSGGPGKALPIKPKHPAPPAVPAPPAPPGASVSVPAPPLTGPQIQTLQSLAPQQSRPSAQTLVRVAQIWKDDTVADFLKGTFLHTAVTDTPGVRLETPPARIARTGADVIWSLASDPAGNSYIGTGDDGAVYEIPVGASASKLLAKTGDLEVSALAYDPLDDLLIAGTSPGGVIDAIAANGRVTPLCRLDEGYITGMLWSPTQNALYATTGGGIGKIVRIALRDHGRAADAQVLFTSQDQDLLCLAQGKDGTLYAGSDPNGFVYRVAPVLPGPVSSVIFDSPGSTISAVAVSPSNMLTIACAAPLSIYRIDLNALTPSTPPQVATLLPTHPPSPVSAMSVSPDGTVWAAAGSVLYELSPAGPERPGDTEIAAITPQPAINFTTVLAEPGATLQGDPVLLGTSDLGTIYSLGGADSSQSGEFDSAILDAQIKSRWGHISWRAQVPSGAQITLQTRSGDVPLPDSTWSDWTDAADGSGSEIIDPPGRFLQYRALFAGSAAGAPELDSVSVSYLPEDRPPVVAFTSPGEDDMVSGNEDIKWIGTDPDGDTLDFTLFYSKDSGAHWIPIDTKPIRSAASGPDTTPSASDDSSTQTQSSSDETMSQTIGDESDIPPSVRAQMEQMAAEDAAAATSDATDTDTGDAVDTVDANTTDAPLRTSDYEWNTKSVPDGTYMLRIVASDAPSNGPDGLTADADSQPFVIANTPPTITLDAVAINSGGVATIHGVAQAHGVGMTAVQYRIDGSDWSAAQADSGMFDGPTTAFTVTTAALSRGKHTIDIEAIDAAGNVSTQSVAAQV